MNPGLNPGLHSALRLTACNPNLNPIITTTPTYASQIRAVKSHDAVTTRAPSGEKAAHQT